MFFFAALVFIAGCSDKIEGGNTASAEEIVPTDEKSVTLIAVGNLQWQDDQGHTVTKNDISNLLQKGYHIKVCPDHTLKMCGQIQSISLVTTK